MQLTDFTSFDEIRAALGVSTDELEDRTLSLPLYRLSLAGEFDDISTTLVADFTALSPDPGTLTANETRFDAQMRLFATYAVAKHLTGALPLFSPKDVTDGKAAVSRYTTDPWRETVKAILGSYDRHRQRLVDAYAAVKSVGTNAPATRTYVLASKPASDPVLGT